MVYYGIPSRGCAPCRARKTKCDQSIPSCGQCLRAGRNCTGYRNEHTLVFRDETNKVMGKVQAAKRGRNIIFPAENMQADSHKLPNPSTKYKLVVPPPTTHTQAVCQSISVPLEDQAIVYFFRNYVFPDVGSSRTPLGCMPGIYSRASADSALPAIVTSIGMAGMAGLRNFPEMMNMARQKHISVLRLINSSLQDSESAKADQTLTAVLLLGLFETVIGSQESLKSWAKHIVGAAALIQIRGQDQMQSDVGRRLFRFLRAQIVIDCLQRLRLLPDIILRWSVTGSKDEGVDWLVEHQLYQILARLCALRKAIYYFEHDVRYRKNEVRSLACSIDVDFADWANCLPLDYSYKIRIDGNHEYAFSKYSHSYKGFWPAGVWNIYRSARILTNEIILKTLSSPPASAPVTFDALRLASVAVSTQLCSEICTSVSFYFGGEFSSNSSTYVPMAASGHAVIWPLFIVGTFPEISAFVQGWVIKLLAKIGELAGIRQATSLAYILRTKARITAWDVKRASRVEVVDAMEFLDLLKCASERPTTSLTLRLSDAEIA